MAQIGTIKLQTQNNGTVDVPVFDTGDSGSSIYEFVRVQTGSGTGFIPVEDTSSAAYPYLRVQSQSHGTVAVTDRSSTIPDSALTQDLVAWYRFEDGDAKDYTNDLDATFADSTAYDGTVNGATFQSSGGVKDFETGANSGAYNFDGSNDWIDLSGSGLDTTVGSFSSITTMAWASVDNTDENQLVFQTGSARWTIGYKPFGPNGWGFRGADGNAVTIDSGDATTDTYVHICATWDGSQIEFYLDGVSQGTVPYSNIDDNGQISISSQNDGVRDFFDGEIDDVRVYNRALTDKEVSDIYNATKP